ncbi:hypothetical protein ACGFX2_34425 [Streptomyces goshikiensis]|uniref:hypothetical protein n=1 Tax=Streptomyces goshikiensis TaxID=1942 RepID=UPI0037155E52
MTGQFFPTPPGYNLKDARDAQTAISLLRGEKVDMPNTVISLGVDRREALDQVSGGRLAFAAKYQAMDVTFGQHQVDLGPGIGTFRGRTLGRMPWPPCWLCDQHRP